MDLLGWLGGESTAISTVDAFFRLSIAAIFGGIVGFDRELRNKPAGLRTHMLVSLAAAIFTLLSLEIYFEVMNKDPNATADVIRIIEAVTSGVAFLAAGAIIQSRGAVRGITTGANMWFAGALGVACGAGFYQLAALGTALAVVVLTVIGALEARVDGVRENAAVGGDDEDPDASRRRGRRMPP